MMINKHRQIGLVGLSLFLCNCDDSTSNTEKEPSSSTHSSSIRVSSAASSSSVARMSSTPSTLHEIPLKISCEVTSGDHWAGMDEALITEGKNDTLFFERIPIMSTITVAPWYFIREENQLVFPEQNYTVKDKQYIFEAKVNGSGKIYKDSLTFEYEVEFTYPDSMPTVRPNFKGSDRCIQVEKFSFEK